MVIRDGASAVSRRGPGSVAAVAYSCVCLAAATALVATGHLVLSAVVLGGVVLRLLLTDSLQ
jgi:hypothetical protein